jgi:myo-inositol-1(or 4)-monophosphatase
LFANDGSGMMRRMVPSTFVFDLLAGAGEIALDYFRADLSVENKASGQQYDPVTEADRAIETFLRNAILTRYPDHGIVAEEFGDHAPAARWRWYIDPIDGTRAFMSGSPLWGTLLGLTCDGAPLMGALGQPFLGEIFFAMDGAGELIRGEQRQALRSRPTAALAEAVLYCTDPDMFLGDVDRARRFDALSERVLLRRFGGDCYSYGMLAAGFIDLVVESGLKPFDIVPLIPVLQSAGAVVTDWRGQSAMAGGHIVAAANPTLHAQALAILNN